MKVWHCLEALPLSGLPCVLPVNSHLTLSSLKKDRTHMQHSYECARHLPLSVQMSLCMTAATVEPGGQSLACLRYLVLCFSDNAD